MTDDKDIKTLIPDIYSLLCAGGHAIDEKNLDECMQSIFKALKEAIEVENNLEPKAELRLSKTGTGLRKLWFEHNLKLEGGKPDPMKVGPNLMRFLTGHITEAVLILLAKEAGHTVTHAQETVELEGVPGHCDAVIDGHMTDIKTASQFSYDKFRTGDITWGKDPFGYVAQISSYKKALDNAGVKLKDTCFFWAYNKSNSDMVLTPVNKANQVDSEAMLRKQKAVISQPTPPSELCFPEEDFGKSGNKSINKSCVFCPFKHECFKSANGGRGLRVFKYSNKDEYLTQVNSLPNVEEITGLTTTEKETKHEY